MVCCEAISQGQSVSTCVHVRVRVCVYVFLPKVVFEILSHGVRYLLRYTGRTPFHVH